jgi:hypothetical protein
MRRGLPRFRNRTGGGALGIGWPYRPDVEPALRAGALESVRDRFAVERPGFFLYYRKALCAAGAAAVGDRGAPGAADAA